MEFGGEGMRIPSPFSDFSQVGLRSTTLAMVPATSLKNERLRANWRVV
jgi:hypothetical protein